MSTERIYEAVLKAAADHSTRKPFKTHLDVGPGSGRLINLLEERFGVHSRACDYTDALIGEGRTVDIVNLNRDKLPYSDGSFDVVTATEVVEHLEHFRETLRDIYRVVKPGGLCILTTPNILNLNSRLRNLWFGFGVLFGPLPISNNALHSTAGHVNPVSYFYLAHGLLDAGFSSVSLSFDKYQRSGLAKLLVWGLPIKLMGALAFRREQLRYHTIDGTNAPSALTSNVAETPSRSPRARFECCF